MRPQDITKAEINDSYTSMTNLGFAPGSVGAFDTSVAAEFWHSRVFVKTYKERRTWAAVYRAYYRVWCFHIVAYQFLQVLAFEGWDWRFLSSCIVTQANMKAIERLCNWFMTNDPPEPLNTTLTKTFATKGRSRMSQAGLRAVQRLQKAVAKESGSTELAARSYVPLDHAPSRGKRRHHVMEGRPLYGIFGFVEWVLLGLLTLVWYIVQFIESPLRVHARDWWAVFSAVYLVLHVIHWLLTVVGAWFLFFAWLDLL